MLQLACKNVLDVSAGDSPDEFAKLAFASSFVWLKLMRRSVIEKAHLRFPTGASEDVPFDVSLLINYKKRGYWIDNICNITVWGERDTFLAMGLKWYGLGKVLLYRLVKRML